MAGDATTRESEVLKGYMMPSPGAAEDETADGTHGFEDVLGMMPSRPSFLFRERMSPAQSRLWVRLPARQRPHRVQHDISVRARGPPRHFTATLRH